MEKGGVIMKNGNLGNADYNNKCEICGKKLKHCKGHGKFSSKTMKRAVILFLFVLICVSGLLLFSSLESKEALPEKVGTFEYLTVPPKEFQALFSGLKMSCPPILITADIDIPDLPRIDKFQFVYTVWDGSIGRGLEGFNYVEIGTKKSLWPIKFFSAIGNDAAKDTNIHEMYHSGFIAAMFKAGVNVKVFKLMDDGREIFFKYEEKGWSMTQLSEAVAEVGLIRRFEKVKAGNDAIARQKEIMKAEIESFALARYLAKKANGDPEAYIAELEKLIPTVVRALKKMKI